MESISDDTIWNLKSLDQPPIVKFDYTPAEYNNLFAQTNFSLLFSAELDKLIHILNQSESVFLNEKYLLDKIIYKNWNPLRKEKTLQLMRKLKRALNLFIEIKLNDLLETIAQISKAKQLDIFKNSKSLPSKELLEFLLVRLLSSYKLLDHGMTLIKTNILYYIIKLIKNAIYLTNNILFMSIISRVYCLFKKYKQHISYVYNSLREYINLFKATSIKWSDRFNIESLPLSLAPVSHDDGDDLKFQDVVKKFESKVNGVSNGDQVKVEEKVECLEFEDYGQIIDRNAFSGAVNGDEHKSLNEKFYKKFEVLIKLSLAQEKNSNEFKLKLFKKKFQKYVKLLKSKQEYSKSELVDLIGNKKSLNLILKSNKLKSKKKIIFKSLKKIINKIFK